ncbi:MAG: DUF4135 domain-containing protein, partial [Prosthecobacter sp.]
MQPIPFAQFEQIAEKYAEENSSIKLKSGGGSVRDSLEKRKTTDSVFAKREIKAEQNLHVMDEFRKALESRFGAAGRMAFEQQLSDKVDAAQSLRPADINMTIAVAKGAAVGFVADGVMSQAELDTRAAMQHVTLPPGPRGEMLRKEVFDALAQIAPQFAAIDRSGDGRLLAKLGTNLAETLDQKYVLTAVAKEFTARLDEPYSALIDELTTRERTPGHALQQILNDHPPLERAFRTEVDQFVVNSQKLADRLATDMAHINADFDSLRPLGAGPATGIKDIHITSSDPHHGGNRVCILTLDNDQKIVYKPRDVRIDAALVGHQGPAPDDLNTLNDNNRSLVEIGNSLLVNNGDINAPARMPTLQFLPKQDAAGVGTNEGRYGYVQCLSNGTEQD